MKPLDVALGIDKQSYSPGVREMCCRLSLNQAFAPASETLCRTAQLTVSSNALRDLVEREGQAVAGSIQDGRMGPDWTAEDLLERKVYLEKEKRLARSSLS